LIENPSATVKQLMKFVPGPDFPTGGEIVGLEGVREAYATGKGSFKVRATVEIEKVTSRKMGIIIKELPYTKVFPHFGIPKATGGHLPFISNMQPTSTNRPQVIWWPEVDTRQLLKWHPTPCCLLSFSGKPLKPWEKQSKSSQITSI
jgi:hypothetical protein